MKLGVIDIGSNSIRLLLAEVVNNKIIDSYKTLRTTRLSKGVDSEGYLSEESMDVSIGALKEYEGLMKDYGIENKPIAIATSAIRDSKNRDEFVERINSLGIDVDVISGDEEARLGFNGVAKGMDIGNDNILVVDIGGGSTELVLGNMRDGIISKISLNIGAVRLTERHMSNDPPSSTDLLGLSQDIEETLKSFLKDNAKHNIKQVVGIGGTITNLASMDQKMLEYDSEKIHGYSVELDDIEVMKQELCDMDTEQRKEVAGLQRTRADVIIAGVVIAEIILRSFGKNSIIVSESDNLEGLLYEKVEQI